jgi:hypothetical protein
MPYAHQRRRILSGRYARANPMVDIMQGLSSVTGDSLPGDGIGHALSVPEDLQ